MEDNNYITITDNDGNEVKFEFLTMLESEDGNKYVVYTDNEVDSDDNVNIFTSKVIVVDGEETLVDLNDEEWNDIRSYLDQIINSDDDEEE